MVVGTLAHQPCHCWTTYLDLVERGFRRHQHLRNAQRSPQGMFLTYRSHGLFTISLSSVTKQNVGVIIFGLYIAQIGVGAFIHFVRIPILFVGHRPPQNYFHALFGLAILAMAAYQVRLLPPHN